MAVPTLADLKAQLNITTTTHDAELDVFLSAALRLIEARVGPSTVQTITEQVSTHGGGFNLSRRPVVSITTITPQIDGWTAVDSADVAFDTYSGAVWATNLMSLAGQWEVVYTAGWSDFPDNYNLATLITAQHLWRTQRGGSKRPNQGGADELNLNLGYAISRSLRGSSIMLPAAAMELIWDAPTFGGIA